MVNKQQLNSLAVEAQKGNDSAMWEIKLRFQSMIHNFSDSNRHRMVSQASFEDECFRIIENTVSRFDPEKGDLSQLVVNFIKRRLSQCNKRHIAKSKGAAVIELRCSNESEDGFTEYDIKDDLAIIDESFLLKEKITDLAAGDPKKVFVLNSMVDPGYRELHTAKLLAQLDGRSVDTHRKFIQRFRKQCKSSLAKAN